MSKLLEMWARHDKEIEELKRDCKHLEEHLKIRYDHSCVGAGSRYPGVHIVCTNCGTKKVMFIQSEDEHKVKIIKTLKRQKGIKDQRLGCSAVYRWEIDGR